MRIIIKRPGTVSTGILPATLIVGVAMSMAPSGAYGWTAGDSGEAERLRRRKIVIIFLDTYMLVGVYMKSGIHI
jgi:hypothetical protein